jgi:c-di-AMP phosphodiesterase-like protein
MMAARIDLTEDTNTVLDKIDNQTYLVQFDVPNNVFYLTDKTKTQYNMPTYVQ